MEWNRESVSLKEVVERAVACYIPHSIKKILNW